MHLRISTYLLTKGSSYLTEIERITTGFPLHRNKRKILPSTTNQLSEPPNYSKDNSEDNYKVTCYPQLGYD